MQIGFNSYKPAMAGVQVPLSIPANPDYLKSVPSYKRQTDKKGKKDKK